jgi:hypothetical protein
MLQLLRLRRRAPGLCLPVAAWLWVATFPSAASWSRSCIVLPLRLACHRPWVSLRVLPPPLLPRLLVLPHLSLLLRIGGLQRRVFTRTTRQLLDLRARWRRAGRGRLARVGSLAIATGCERVPHSRHGPSHRRMLGHVVASVGDA